MTLVSMNLQGAELLEHGTGRPASTALKGHIAGTGPIVILIHGFKFSPGAGQHCPHDHILSLTARTDCWKALSWPQALGLDASSDALGIAFGWPARGSIWQAYDRANEAGRALARLIRHLHQIAPTRPVNIMAHSLGARVALSALPNVPDHAINRIVLLAGAEFQKTAQDLMDTPAGRTTEVISITSRENRPYDRLLERALTGPAKGRAIGRCAPVAQNWLTLPISTPDVLSGLAALGFDIAPSQRWFCHWSSYLRPGVFALYSALVASDRPLPMARLRRATEIAPPPVQGTRLWSMLPRPSFGFGRTAG